MSINSIQYLLGESPIYNHYNDSLFWVDIDGYKVLQFDDHTTKIYYVPNKKPTSISLVDQSIIFLTVEDGYGYLDLRSEEFIQLYTVPKRYLDRTRLNDGKCDRTGKLWIASKDLLNKDRTGYLFSLQSKELIPQLEHIGIGNGLAFSPHNDQLYFADSLTGKLSVFDYDSEKCKISNEQLIYQSYTPEFRTPDGGTTDINGRYYSAMYGDGSIYIYNDTRIDDIIKIPSIYTTSCCFGGKDTNRLFVTTAYDKKTQTGGYVYCVKTETIGIRENRIII